MGQPLQWLQEKICIITIGRGKKLKHLYLHGILTPLMASFTLIIMYRMRVSKAKVADQFAGVLRKMPGPWWGRGWSTVVELVCWGLCWWGYHSHRQGAAMGVLSLAPSICGIPPGVEGVVVVTRSSIFNTFLC